MSSNFYCFFVHDTVQFICRGDYFMLRCNLSNLLKVRNLNISMVSKDTGISRTTLTMLANNTGKGIQYDTMNTLCKYFSISPEQLFSFISIDIDLTTDFFINLQKFSDYLKSPTVFSATIDIMVDEFIYKKSFKVAGNIFCSCFNMFDVTFVDYLIIYLIVGASEDKDEIKHYIDLLPSDFYMDISKKFCLNVSKEYSSLNSYILENVIKNNKNLPKEDLLTLVENRLTKQVSTDLIWIYDVVDLEDAFFSKNDFVY